MMKTREEIIRGYATQISEEVIEAINNPGGFDNIESAVESSLDEMYGEIIPEEKPLEDLRKSIIENKIKEDLKNFKTETEKYFGRKKI